ncbi:MAG TPA: TonB-dependent receptor [Opitutaceae bacterium]|nr:TonB-dependent receptor [Opitutaceae bacterium]
MSRASGIPVLVVAGVVAFAATGAAGDEVVTLPPFVTTATRVANETPAITVPMPVTSLSYEPAVDVQARNFAEGQADIAVRGGVFENTGFQLGGAAVVDPQTGHYAAELPISPTMLSPVRVLTGAEAAFAGINASVATLAYDWAPIETRGELTLGGGDYSTWRSSVYQGIARSLAGGGRLGFDAELAHSESNGAIKGGDHDFTRYAGRLQYVNGAAQTDLFAGYQEKFFGWPNLYTPFGWLESENLRTTLVTLNHRIGAFDGDFLQASALWRRNLDDYEADRTQPGRFNPYEHETQVTAVSLDGRRELGADWAVRGRAEAAADTLRSTSLTAGRFDSRSYWKLGVSAERTFSLSAADVLELEAGATWADDNRGGGALAPLAVIAWRRAEAGGGNSTRVYAQVAGDSQVSSYTALNSAAGSGLFRGNPDLGRARSTNYELGVQRTFGRFEVQSAFFFRRDRDLTDWTYRQGVTARTANAVDIDTTGFEAVATYRWSRGRAVLGYTWLGKSEDYGSALVDASFYALNYARHRVTAALVWQPVKQVELRLDNEYRQQEPNFLRRSSNRAILSAASVRWFVPQVRGLEVSVQVDNLWNCGFEEVPAVPAAPRQYSAGFAYRW